MAFAALPSGASSSPTATMQTTLPGGTHGMAPMLGFAPHRHRGQR